MNEYEMMKKMFERIGANVYYEEAYEWAKKWYGAAYRVLVEPDYERGTEFYFDADGKLVYVE